MSVEAAAADPTDQLMQASVAVARHAASERQMHTLLFLLASNTDPNGSFGRLVKYIRAVARAKAQGVNLVPATVKRQIGVLMGAHETCNRLGASALDHCHQIGRLVHMCETLDVLDQVGADILAHVRASHAFFAYSPLGLRNSVIDEPGSRASSTLSALALLPTHAEPGKALDLFKRAAGRLLLSGGGSRALAPYFLAQLVNTLAVHHNPRALLPATPAETSVLAVRASILRWICDDPLSLFRHDFTQVYVLHELPTHHELLIPFLDALFRSPSVYDASAIAAWQAGVPDVRRLLFEQYIAMHLPDSRAAAAAGDLANAQKVIVRAFTESNIDQAERRGDVTARLPSEIVGKVFAHLYHDETPATTKDGATTSTTPFAQLLTREARNAMFGADLERQAHGDVTAAAHIVIQQQTQQTQQQQQQQQQQVRERSVRAREHDDDDDENVYGYADDAGTNDGDGDADMDGLEQQAASLRVSSTAPPPTKRGRASGRAAAFAQQQFDW